MIKKLLILSIVLASFGAFAQTATAATPKQIVVVTCGAANAIYILKNGAKAPVCFGLAASAIAM